jgi:hypothetical protein
MPLEMLRWLVTVVVLYAATVMARSAWVGWKGERPILPLEPVAG